MPEEEEILVDAYAEFNTVINNFGGSCPPLGWE
jgi:hypothetical protein